MRPTGRSRRFALHMFRMPVFAHHTTRSLLERGELLLDLAEFEAAADCLERAAAALAPSDPARGRVVGLTLEARADRARQHVHAQRFPLAAREVARALLLDPRRPELLWLRARLAERSGRVEDALDDLLALEDSQVRSVASTLLEASCWVQLDDAAAFDAVMTRAAKIATEHPCGIASGRMEVRLDAPRTFSHPIDAVGRMRCAVSARPADTTRRTVLAELLLDAGWVEEAELHLAVARSIDPDDAAVTRLRGRACLERRDVSGALECFARAAGKLARYPDLWLWTGLALLCGREIPQAKEALTRALELNRRYAAAWQATAVTRFVAGDAPGAALAVRQVTLRHRERPAYPGGFYRALAQDPDDAALRELRRAAALHPDYADLTQAFGLALRTRRGRNTNGALEERAAMEAVEA